MQRAAALTTLVGAGLVVLSTVPAGLSGDAALLPVLAFTAWALVPYALLYVARHARWPWPLLGAAAATTAVDVGIRLSVFVFPRGSTAAIALLFSPLVEIIAAIPIGAGVGWLVGRAVRSGSRVLGVAAVTLGVVALGLTGLGLARPDLFPSTVYARRQAVSRIGLIGVHVGGDRFHTVPVTTRSGWFLTGDFDGQPGDEVGVANRGEVELFDGRTFAPLPSVPLEGDAANWNWYSQLARSRGGLVRVDGGGGFQETQVFAPDGTRVFRYHPDETLPPNALRAADLDDDGELEFYASTQTFLTRLDVAGQELWRQHANATELVALQPATPLGPPWLVTRDYGRPATIWSPQGAQLTTVPTRDAEYRPMVGVVEWLDRRLLAYGGDRLTLRTADGTTVFEWTVPDMHVTGAWVVRFDAQASPLLVVQATADRDTKRARLQVLDADRTLHYDEVTEQMPRVLTVRRDDGTSALLLGTTGLRALSATPVGGST